VTYADHDHDIDVMDSDADEEGKGTLEDVVAPTQLVRKKRGRERRPTNRPPPRHIAKQLKKLVINTAVRTRGQARLDERSSIKSASPRLTQRDESRQSAKRLRGREKCVTNGTVSDSVLS
jgi:hypothetical protein